MNYKDYQNKNNIALRLLIDCKINEKKFSIVDICEQIGIKVKSSSLQDNKVGICLMNKDQPYILIDPKFKSVTYKRFTIAHELGHILLGHLDCSKKPENIEQEADDFATDIIAHGYLMSLKEYLNKP